MWDGLAMTRAKWLGKGEVVAAGWSAAAEAAQLLAQLGWRARAACGTGACGTGAALTSGSASVVAAPTLVGQDWAGSGAMALTGQDGGPCRHPVGRPATVARGASLALELVTGAVVDGPALLGERAALLGLRRGGQTSPGGGTRLMAAADGWWALNLARDRDLVPALTSGVAGDDPWQQAERWGRGLPLTEILGRTRLLGLAAGSLAETAAPSALFRTSARPATAAGRDRPLVVNLGALWAGPLAASLLALAGAEVIDVESLSRPDPTRLSSPAFYALLHDGHRRRAVDFTDPAELRSLLGAADIVIEASRRRALRSLGAGAGAVLADGRARTWLRIAGHRDPSRVAFGDDAAVAGGLVAWDRHLPVFAGDAIADPLTGLLGALAIAALHSQSATTVIDIAMADVAAYCAVPPGGQDPASTDIEPAPPRIACRRSGRPSGRA
jgi:hypothetical protein